MKTARFEHYVPRVYLKSFVAAGRGKDSIYCFDKVEGKSYLRNIMAVAGAKDFYKLPSVDVNRIEDYLGRIESDFAPARDRLLRSADLKTLTESERRAIAYFAATQFVRTLEIQGLVRDLAKEVKTSLSGAKMSKALTDQIEGAQSDQAIREVHFSIIGEIPAMAGNILEKKWIMICNETEMPFWTSDHPVNLRNEIKPPGLSRIGIGVPGIQIYLPLSPALSLLFCDFAYYMYEPDKLAATDVNNVIFQNDWQLRWATRYVFSNVDDFSLARRIIEDVPEIKDVEKHRVQSSRLRRPRTWPSGSG